MVSISYLLFKLYIINYPSFSFITSLFLSLTHMSIYALVHLTLKKKRKKEKIFSLTPFNFQLLSSFSLPLTVKVHKRVVYPCCLHIHSYQLLSSPNCSFKAINDPHALNSSIHFKPASYLASQKLSIELPNFFETLSSFGFHCIRISWFSFYHSKKVGSWWNVLSWEGLALECWVILKGDGRLKKRPVMKLP